MELANILRMIGRRWYVPIITGVIALLVTTPTQYHITGEGLVPKSAGYRVSTRLLINLANPSDIVQNTSIIRLFLVGFLYGQVIESPGVAEQVSKRVGGAYTPEELRERVHGFSLAPSAIFNIDAFGDSPEDAVAIAQAFSAAIQDWAHDRQERFGTPDNDRITMQVLEEARVEEVLPMAQMATKWMTFAFMAGLWVGIVFVLSLPTPEPRPRRAVRRAQRVAMRSQERRLAGAKGVALAGSRK